MNLINYNFHTETPIPDFSFSNKEHLVLISKNKSLQLRILRLIVSILLNHPDERIMIICNSNEEIVFYNSKLQKLKITTLFIEKSAKHILTIDANVYFTSPTISSINTKEYLSKINNIICLSNVASEIFEYVLKLKSICNISQHKINFNQINYVNHRSFDPRESFTIDEMIVVTKELTNWPELWNDNLYSIFSHFLNKGILDINKNIIFNRNIFHFSEDEYSTNCNKYGNFSIATYLSNSDNRIGKICSPISQKEQDKK